MQTHVKGMLLTGITEVMYTSRANAVKSLWYLGGQVYRYFRGISPCAPLAYLKLQESGFSFQFGWQNGVIARAWLSWSCSLVDRTVSELGCHSCAVHASLNQRGWAVFFSMLKDGMSRLWSGLAAVKFDTFWQLVH